MQAADPRAPATDAGPDAVRAAFRDLHGRRLHGFALLLTLGDWPRAARLTADALGAADPLLDELRHPERAAAWLRTRVVHAARGVGGRKGRLDHRLRVLGDLGVDRPVLAGLTALGHSERAALIAADVERLDWRDVATIVGHDDRALDRRLQRARRLYAAAYAAALPEVPTGGRLTERVREIAMRVLG